MSTEGENADRVVPGSNRPRWKRKWEQLWSHLLQYRCQISAIASSRCGVCPREAGPEIIVSLTSTAARLNRVHLTVETLLRQSLRPHRVVLWLDEKLESKELSRPLQRQQSRGLEIRYRRDLRSFTKLIYALREHPWAIIVTADDDVFYPRHWLRQLHDSYSREPEAIHCQRAHLFRESADGSLAPYLLWDFLARRCNGPSPWLFPTGVDGVFYPPGALPAETLSENIFTRLCPTADDVSFKAMSLAAEVPVIKTSAGTGNFLAVPGTQRESLCSFNWRGNHYDEQIRAVFGYYDLLPISKKRPCFNEVCPLFNCGLFA